MSEKPWLKNYPTHVPAEIGWKCYDSIPELIQKICQKFSRKSAITNFGVHLSYSRLYQLSEYFAAFLQQKLQLKKGNRIAIMLPNVMQYHVVMFGALRAGLVVVNVNPLYTHYELAEQLHDAEVTAVVVLANFASVLQSALPKIPSVKQVIVTEIADLLGFGRAWFGNWWVRHVKKQVPSYQISGVIDFRTALRQGRKQAFKTVSLCQKDLAFLQYTGGTTGTPKAAMLTHGNILANVEQAYDWVMGGVLRAGEEVVIAPLPLYHIFSLTVCAFCFLKMGASVVLVTNPKDISSLIRLLRRTSYSVLIGINTLCNALLQHPDFKRLSFKTLKMVIAGGMPVQSAMAEAWQRVTGKVIIEGYGLTEASPIVTINRTDEPKFTGSVGFPIPSTEVSIRQDEGKPLPIGEIGEIWVRGPQVMSGYWRNQAETRAVLTEEGWLKTGDMGRLDALGLLYLVDRKKDMILVSGFNVYPNEVEAVLSRYPGVIEVAVVGVPSSTSGEAVKAFVIKADPNITAEHLIAFCHQHLAHYKTPKIIEFVSELPKSPVGKVLRRRLR